MDFSDIFGILFFLLVAGLIGIIRKLQEKSASDEAQRQQRQSTIDELPEKTRRMLYGDNVPTARQRGAGQPQTQMARPRRPDQVQPIPVRPTEQPAPEPFRQEREMPNLRGEARQIFEELRETLHRDPSADEMRDVFRQRQEEARLREQQRKQEALLRQQEAQRRKEEEERLRREQHRRQQEEQQRQRQARMHGLDPIQRAEAQIRRARARKQKLRQRHMQEPIKSTGAPAQAPRGRRRPTFALLSDLDDVRRGIILSEVLGTPKSLR